MSDDPPASGISEAPTAGTCPRCGVPGPPGAACPACGFDASGEAFPRATLGQGDVVFPGFTVLRHVAAGGMGEVLQAHPDRHVGDLRAIKVIRPELVGNARTERLFQDEVVAVQRIVHPGVVRVFHCGRATDGRMFVVMEWLPGRSLADAIRDPASPVGDPEHPALPALAAALVRQLGAALDATHAEDVQHRDIKPTNVMLCREPAAGDDPAESPDSTLQAKLIDFGIARLGDGARTGQSASVALGTVEHMAPEVARGDPTTARTDVYLLAQLMYRVVTGLRRTTGAPRPPSRVNPRFPRELDDLFADALADEPRYRPASAGELASALAGLLDGVTAQEVETERQVEAEAEEKATQRARAKKKARRREQVEEKARRQAEADTVGLRQSEAVQGAPSEAESETGDPGGQRHHAATSPGLVAALARALGVLALGVLALGLLTLLVVARTRGGEREEPAGAVASGSSTPAPTPAPAPTPTSRSALDPFIHQPSGLRMVHLPGGTFQMGSPTDHGSYDEHGPGGGQVTVTLSPFALGVAEVTNEEYAAYLTKRGGSNTCGEGSCVNTKSDSLKLTQSGNRWTANSGYEKHPVVEVTWHGANTFATEQGLVLPTEAQWEYACREGKRQRKWAGTDTEGSLVAYANVSGDADGHGGLAPVAKLAANGWGLHDLSGNVWEWTADWYDDAYPAAPGTDPKGPSGGLRVYRGGSFGSTPADARCADRPGASPSNGWSDLGFRVALPPQR